jgi:hypothetical protein
MTKQQDTAAILEARLEYRLQKQLEAMVQARMDKVHFDLKELMLSVSNRSFSNNLNSMSGHIVRESGDFLSDAIQPSNNQFFSDITTELQKSLFRNL